MSFIKKSLICKEKAGTVTKVKLRSIISLFWNLGISIVHIVPVEITHKIQISFKTLASKKAATWRLKKSRSNDKLS